MVRRLLSLTFAAALLAAVVACSGGDDDDSPATGSTGPSAPSGTITLYSGRAEALVGPLLEQFERDTGINVEVRYGGSAPMAAMIAEEGNATPADVFWAQDPGPLGFLSDRFAPISDEVLARVDDGFKSPEKTWIGVSGRIRVVVYNPDRVQVADLPKSMQELTDAKWNNRIGWAPSNASFQIMVTAMRTLQSDAAATTWLQAVKDNGAKTYGNNNAVLLAVAAGEVDIGIINHYYLHAARRTTPDIKAENHYLNNEDPGSLIMVSGAGILKTTDNMPAAQAFIDYLLSPAAQQYFASQTSEYPLIDGVITPPNLTPLAQLRGPDVDLSDLNDLAGTLTLLRQAGLVQ